MAEAGDETAGARVPARAPGDHALRNAYSFWIRGSVKHTSTLMSQESYEKSLHCIGSFDTVQSDAHIIFPPLFC